MARVKIVDLPEDQKISRAEMKKVSGGLTPTLGAKIGEQFGSVLELTYLPFGTSLPKK